MMLLRIMPRSNIFLIFLFITKFYAQVTYSLLSATYFEDIDILNDFTFFPQLTLQPSPLYFNACGLSYVGGSSVFSTGLYNYAHIEYRNIPPHYQKQIILTLYKAQSGSNHFYLNLGTIGNVATNYYYVTTVANYCDGMPVYPPKVFNITDNLDQNIYIEFGISYDNNTGITDIFGFRNFEFSFFPCIANCIVCSNNITCSQCDTSNNYGLDTSSQCSLCPTGTYPNSTNSFCTSCVSPCLTCNGLTSSNCLSCVQSYYLEGSSCIGCDPTCLICSGPNSNQCLSCLSPLVLNVNSCITTCPPETYMDDITNSCLSCSEFCYNCNGGLNCTSCLNGYYLITNILNNNLCMAVENINTTLKFSEYNPFLLEVDFQKNYSFIDANFLQTILSLQTTGSSENVSYSIMLNPNNNLSYYLLFSYANETFPPNSYLKVSFNDSTNKSFTFMNSSSLLSLNSINLSFCSQNQYFDTYENKCVGKLNIEYSLSYTDQANVILIQFNSMYADLQQSILKGLFIFEIDDMTPLIDFNSSLIITSNSIYITFSFSKSVIGGKYLNTVMNQTIYFPINYLANTTFLINQNSSIKLMEYYLLSNKQVLIMNQTASATSIGNILVNPLVYFNLGIKPNGVRPIIGIIFLNMIEMLKYIEINYPPNAMKIFQTTSFDIFKKSDLFTEISSNLPPIFQYYNIKNDIINNLSESYLILFSFIALSVFVKLLALINPKQQIILKILTYLKTRFVWNILVLMFFSKYMNTSFFLFLFIRYELRLSASDSEAFLNFALAWFCLIYVILFPFHIYKTIKNLISIREQKNENISNFKKNAVCPIFTTSDVNKKSFILKNITITESEKANELQNIDPINVLKKKSKNSIKADKFEETIENKKVENLEDETHNIVFENNFEIKFSESNVPVNFSPFSPHTYSTNAILLSPKSKSNQNFIKKSIQTDPFRMSVNWKEMNEYVTPQLRKTEDLNNKQNDVSLDGEITNKELINDKNEESFPNHPENKNKMSKFKELELKPIKNINIEKKILDATPLYNPNNIKKNNNDKESNIINNFCHLIFRILSYLGSLIKNFKNIYKIKDPNEYTLKYSSLMKDYNKNQSPYKILFDIFRFFMISVVIIGLYGLDILQISILNLVNLILLGYLLFKRPFDTKSKIIISLINELCIFLSYGSAFILSLLGPDKSVDTRMNLGWIIVFSYLFLLYFLILSTILTILKGFRCQRKKKSKISAG